LTGKTLKSFLREKRREPVEWRIDPIQDKAVVVVVKTSKIGNIRKITHWHRASGFFVGINTFVENLYGF
jgi:hypothetical protein